MAIPILLDDFDHRLLALLQDDAARTLTALGEAVGLSPSAVQRRITRYRKHGLLQQVAVLDSTAFPAVVLAAVWVTMERESVRTLNAFYARMRAAPEVQQCYQLAGDWDYLVIMATTSVGAVIFVSIDEMPMETGFPRFRKFAARSWARNRDPEKMTNDFNLAMQSNLPEHISRYPSRVSSPLAPKSPTIRLGSPGSDSTALPHRLAMRHRQ